jgi:hypothetical protein
MPDADYPIRFCGKNASQSVHLKKKGCSYRIEGSWNAGNLLFSRQDTEPVFTGVDFNP